MTGAAPDAYAFRGTRSSPSYLAKEANRPAHMHHHCRETAQYKMPGSLPQSQRKSPADAQRDIGERNG